MGFKENLKMLRKAKGMTQEELGKLINKSKLTIIRYERGETFPNTEILIKISDIFDNISLTALLIEYNYNDNKKYIFKELKAELEIEVLKKDSALKENAIKKDEKKTTISLREIPFKFKENLEKNHNFFINLKYEIFKNLINKPNINKDEKEEEAKKIAELICKYMKFLIDEYNSNND